MAGSDHCMGLAWAHNGPKIDQIRLLGTGQEPSSHMLSFLSISIDFHRFLYV